MLPAHRPLTSRHYIQTSPTMEPTYDLGIRCGEHAGAADDATVDADADAGAVGAHAHARARAHDADAAADADAADTEDADAHAEADDSPVDLR